MGGGFNRVPYHCSFLLDGDEKILRLAIAWRRVGNVDYGLYLASDPAPSAVFFAAEYTDRGEIRSFLVSDGGVCAGEPWAEDHISFDGNEVVMDDFQAETLSDLAESFCSDWLESFAMSDADKILRRIGMRGVGDGLRGFVSLVSSELPIQIRPEKMPDVLGDAVLTDRNFLYAFKPQAAGMGAVIENRDLLEAKMRMFLELV